VRCGPSLFCVPSPLLYVVHSRQAPRPRRLPTKAPRTVDTARDPLRPRVKVHSCRSRFCSTRPLSSYRSKARRARSRAPRYSECFHRYSRALAIRHSC
jgi:hypothetical protein